MGKTLFFILNRNGMFVSDLLCFCLIGIKLKVRG